MRISSDVIYFSKIKEDAIVPTKRVEDAGFDLYACFDETEITIKPGEIVLVTSGLAMGFSDDYVFIVKERGSTGSIGMAVRMGVVDSGYRGELKIGINNTSNKTIIISKNIPNDSSEDALYYPYSKAIAQGLLIVTPKVISSEISYDQLMSFKSERMETLLGASGK